MLLGYEMYRMLASRKSRVARRRKNGAKADEAVVDVEEQDRLLNLRTGMSVFFARVQFVQQICAFRISRMIELTSFNKRHLRRLKFEDVSRAFSLSLASSSFLRSQQSSSCPVD